MKTRTLNTERLIIRQWRASDTDSFVKLNACPETMKYFPRPFTREESVRFIEKTIKIIEEKGYGLFAVELRETGEFLGFVGLNSPAYETHFTPCIEIGWRIYKDYWGKGYASEAAKRVLKFAFEDLMLFEVVSFTSLKNVPSIRVMERIGMVRDLKGDFDHPNVEPDSPLLRHCLYRIKRTPN